MKAKTMLKCALAVGLPLVLLAPGKSEKAQREPFQNRNFAHRGLHTRDKTVPENSLNAFRLAADAGYGMELDVQLSLDGEVVVFHDDTLSRVCGVDARVDELPLSELQSLSLCGTDQTIPLFSQVLKTVGGRTPIIVELKNGRRNRELCEKTLALLRSYKGQVCIESFNPFIVAWFRFHAPDLLRGQLAMRPKRYQGEGMSPLKGFLLGNTLLNIAARPQFIAYRIEPRPLAVRLSEAMGAMRVGWTAHDPLAEEDHDAVIFEFYRPKTHYEKP